MQQNSHLKKQLSGLKTKVKHDPFLRLTEPSKIHRHVQFHIPGTLTAVFKLLTNSYQLHQLFLISGSQFLVERHTHRHMVDRTKTILCLATLLVSRVKFTQAAQREY